MRVEGDEQARHDRGPHVSRPPVDDQAHGPTGQREAGHDEQVVDDQRWQTGPQQRRAHQRLHEHVFRESECVRLGEKDVGVEQMQRRARQLVRDPADDPFVQHGVAIVVTRPQTWRRGERPGVQHGHGGEERQRRQRPLRANRVQ